MTAGPLQTHFHTQHGVGRGDQDGPPPPPTGIPLLPGFFPKDVACYLMTGGGMLGEGDNPDQILDPLYTLLCAVHTFDSG